MTLAQAKNLASQVAQEYLGEHWNKKLTKIQSKIWEDLLLEWEFKPAKMAVRELFIEHAAYLNEFNYHMPDIDLIKEYYNRIDSLKTKNCPCCNNTRLVSVKAGDSEYTTLCDCLPEDKIQECLAKDSKAKRGWEYFKQNPESKCIAFHCQPSRDNPCLLGIPYYNARKVAFMKRIKADPNYQAGLTFLKKKKVKNMIDEIEEITEELVEDIPEAGLDGVPF